MITKGDSLFEEYLVDIENNDLLVTELYSKERCTGRKLIRTHINHGVAGKKHIFFRNAKELRKYVKE